ncbi:MAG: SET domain-containing protein [Bradyrhizobium sp.]
MPASISLPHRGVVTRLGVSRIHGIGVFAIAPIRAGMNPFANDDRPIRWIDATVVDTLAPESPQRALYSDFGIRRAGLIGCPETFDILGSGWYVNEPSIGTEPNMIATAGFDLIASRDIMAGEELTLCYRTFSDIT